MKKCGIRFRTANMFSNLSEGVNPTGGELPFKKIKKWSYYPTLTYSMKNLLENNRNLFVFS